jgi:endonuclease YncB( thermonuclease family)
MWDYRAAITSVHDGDTVSALLDCGFGYIRENMHIRLLGVYAPELTQTGGPETRQFVVDWLARYALIPLRFPFVVTTARGPRSDREITTLERYVATVESLDRSHNLNMDVQAFVTAQGYGGGIGTP